MGARHDHLAASMSVAWESEVVSARVLATLGDRVSDARMRAQLLVLSSFCRAHASRLFSRLAAMGRGPFPVPPEEISVDENTCAELRRECRRAKISAARYQAMAQLARVQSDLSSAWVCELNRHEEEERAVELWRLSESAGPTAEAHWPGAAVPGR